MMVLVQGTNSFDDYNVFLRAISVALSSLPENDKYFYVYSVGHKKTNSFIFEFCNLSERSLKSRGKKIKYFNVSFDWAEENLKDFNYFIFLSKPNESLSSLAKKAEVNGVELGVFQY